GVRLPVLVFGLLTGSPDEVDAVLSQDLLPTLVDMAPVEALVQGARRFNRSVRVHVKTDTGMGRLGLPPEKTLVVMERIAAVREITIAGTYSHFPLSDEPGNTFTEEQIGRFIEFSNHLASMNIPGGLRHLANSGAIINHPASHLDMVRPGILCYGLYPSENTPRKLDVRPAMTLKTAIMFVKRVKKGTGLSYGLTYRAPRDTTVATLPIGYADGYPRSLSNRAHVLIDGRRYPVVGRVCMDQTLVDLGDDTYPVGQEVVLFGPEAVTADTVASWCGTIPYEITCEMSRRVPRMYSGDTQDAA
ncbi:MAG TPA: alanine racemase, partial [Deltaproteobacteria bacterium]|nr:alanine racemase [Deltaproteobacteria bacterium]